MARKDSQMQKRAENRPQEAQTPLREVRRLTPAIDIFETDQELLVYADLPGVRSEDLEVRVEHHELMVEGHRTRGDETWAYRRAFTLPDTVDTDKIRAECHNGVLKLTLPKSEAVKPRRLPISTA